MYITHPANAQMKAFEYSAGLSFAVLSATLFSNVFHFFQVSWEKKRFYLCVESENTILQQKYYNWNVSRHFRKFKYLCSVLNYLLQQNIFFQRWETCFCVFYPETQLLFFMKKNYLKSFNLPSSFVCINACQVDLNCTALLNTCSADSESKKRSSNQPSQSTRLQSVLVSRLLEYSNSVCNAGVLKHPTKYGLVVSRRDLNIHLKSL